MIKGTNLWSYKNIVMLKDFYFKLFWVIAPYFTMFEPYIGYIPVIFSMF